MLHVSGWYDDCLNGALENFTALSAREASGKAAAQRLIVGPWLHATIGRRKTGDVDYGEAAELDLNQLQLSWFSACLSGKPLESAPVQLFVMGRNAWLHEQEWPVSGTEYVSYYLHSRGNANTRGGDGTLSTLPPEDEQGDQYRFDPTDPVPYSSSAGWKQVGGPDDFASIELRHDVLVYTGPVLTEPLLICGPLRVRLFAATTARDTDWTAKILDVYPDGRSLRLNDGAVRARFRQGHDREIFVSPGAIHEYDIDCWAICVELRPGHRLRLEVSSSAFGKYDVNLNGGQPVGQESEPVIAHQTIFHDQRYPSRLILPILGSR